MPHQAKDPLLSTDLMHLDLLSVQVQQSRLSKCIGLGLLTDCSQPLVYLIHQVFCTIPLDLEYIWKRCHLCILSTFTKLYSHPLPTMVSYHTWHIVFQTLDLLVPIFLKLTNLLSSSGSISGLSSRR